MVDEILCIIRYVQYSIIPNRLSYTCIHIEQLMSQRCNQFQSRNQRSDIRVDTRFFQKGWLKFSSAMWYLFISQYNKYNPVCNEINLMTIN